MKKVEANILVLSGEVVTSELMEKLLKGEGFGVEICCDVEKGLGKLREEKFDMVICELEGEKIKGIEVCKKIRQSFILRHIPIILLVKKEHTIEKIKGIYAGADDYIEKPLQSGEFLTRIKANLWRTKRDLDANPLTKLPGNASILKELEKRLKRGEKFCVGYVDLDKFKEYNNYYGFEKGDKIIKHTARIIASCLEKVGSPNDFLGHIGGDDFIFITSWECINKVCEKIIEIFENDLPHFYEEEDKKRGYIITKDRENRICKIGVMTISIGVTTNKHHAFTHIAQLTQAATEMKNYAKTFSRNVYLIDQRKS